MDWSYKHKEEIDVRTFKDEFFEKQVKNAIIDKMWNLPLVIKTGPSDQNLHIRQRVHGVLDQLRVTESINRYNEIEIVRL